MKAESRQGGKFVDALSVDLRKNYLAPRFFLEQTSFIWRSSTNFAPMKERPKLRDNVRVLN